MTLPARLRAACALAISLPLAAFAASCDADPVHTAAVNALGPEIGGIPKGEYHRAGQPCLICHGGEGPASTEFTVGGTIFYGPAAGTNAPIGVGDVSVTLEDDSKSQFTVTTNCVGNFYVKPSDWPGHPQYPMLVTIAGTVLGTYETQTMQSQIGRNGSCAGCHQYATTDNYFETPGLSYLFPTDNSAFTGTDPSCPVNPVPAELPGYSGP
jgi:hypothetical protein